MSHEHLSIAGEAIDLLTRPRFLLLVVIALLARVLYLYLLDPRHFPL